MKLLIVEDEHLIARFLANGLRSEGYMTAVSPDGDDASERLEREDWDLVILDLRLPGRSGFDVLRTLAAAGNDTPVLVLSARSSTETKVAALEAGATDYLAKPFAFDELVARIRALLRRHRPQPRDETAEPTLGFSLDGRGHELCWRDGRRQQLSEREFALLEYLARRANETVSRERILSAVWQYQFDPRSNIVDVYVGRLRRKLEPAVSIETVRGGGYRLLVG
jgi:DNA-binding response OmpR family regulator